MTKCPVCGAEAVPIVFGLPGPDLFEDAEAGRVVLGGCVIQLEAPNWACKGPVEHRWVGDEVAEERS